MKKSQIAAALALTYVAGTAMPFVNVANAASNVVVRDCTSVAAAAAAHYTAAENLALIGRIEATEAYKVYAALVQIKEAYADLADDKAVDALTTKIGAQGTAGSLEALAKAASDALNTAKGSSNANITAINNYAHTNSTDVAVVVAAIEGGKLQAYDKFVPLYEAVEDANAQVGQTVEGIKGLIKAFNDATYDDTEIADTGSGISGLASDITSESNGSKVYVFAYKLVDAYYKNKEAAQNLADAKTQKDEAVALQKKHVEEILKAVNAVENSNDAYAATSLDEVEEALAKASGTNFGKYNTLASTLDNVKKLVDTRDNDALHKTIMDALNTAGVTDTTVRDTLEKPTAQYTLACSNFDIAVTSNKELPAEGLNMVIEKAANVENNLTKGKMQVVYDIKLSNRNVAFATTAVEGTTYTVTIAVPAGMDGASASVYYVNADNTLAEVASTYADGKITFTTGHFSKYAIIGEAATNTGNGNVDNDDQNQGNVSGGNSSVDGQGQGSQDTTKKPAATVKNPNTGIAPKAEKANVAEGVFATSARTNANASATIAVIAGVASVLAAAVAVIRRFAKRA